MFVAMCVMQERAPVIESERARVVMDGCIVVCFYGTPRAYLASPQLLVSQPVEARGFRGHADRQVTHAYLDFFLHLHARIRDAENDPSELYDP